MKYLDTNVFIYSILSNDKKSEYYKRLLSDVANNKIKACTSVLSWDEIVFTLKKYIGIEKAIFHGEMFLKFPNLILVNSNLSIIVRASELIKKYEIAPRDAIHASTALSCNCDEIISDDKGFDKIKELKRKGFR